MEHIWIAKIFNEKVNELHDAIEKLLPESVEQENALLRLNECSHWINEIINGFVEDEEETSNYLQGEDQQDD